MSRPIYASPRFSLLTALAVMLGVLLGETIATAAIGFGYRIVSLFSLHSLPAADPRITALVTMLAKLLTCALVSHVVLRRAGETWDAVGRVRFTPGLLVVPLVPVIAGIVIFLSEIDNLQRAYPWLDFRHQLDFVPGLEELLGSAWTGPLLTVVVGPIVEEIIFRGLILRGLLGRWRPWLAIAVSTLLFSAIHLNLAQAPITLMLGAVLGWVYVRTRSIGLCALLHGLNNSASYVSDFVPFEVDGFNHVPEGVAGHVFHPWWFDLTGVALFITGLWLIHRFTRPVEAWRRPPVPEPPLLPPRPLAPPVLAQDANRGCQPPVPGELSQRMAAELASLVTSIAQRARAASLVLATAPAAAKDAALAKIADLIDASHEALLAANAQDLASPEAAELSAASRERLTLTAAKLTHLAQSVREVIALPDPVGAELEAWTRPNGLRIRKLRVPIGVIGIIYESRPNVTVDCAVLCLKSGNASILRGGKECFFTNTALAELIRQAIIAAGLPADAVQLIPTTDRAALTTLLKLDTLIHCIIPRGGESLIRYVTANSTIPVIKHYTGVCFVYADRDADPDLAEKILINAKTQRPGVCNAAEQLLVHAAVADELLPRLASALLAKNVQLRCDAASLAILNRSQLSTLNPQLSTAVAPATASDFTAEFLDLIMAVRVVDSLETAIATINRDGSAHSDVIVTRDEAAARRFQAGVDSAAVFWNASTRFNDGFEFGFGAEIGISTDRLHARGPMGLRELCTYKFVIDGDGQVRG
ncbi:MAG: glutamate-5-semialdehyde dehydrogenase [Verrucomicrobia bacterium]|nr:glutamate-5-semialdehyde dehydrogenase [Verrucomicrobiota bacterium]